MRGYTRLCEATRGYVLTLATSLRGSRDDGLNRGAKSLLHRVAGGSKLATCAVRKAQKRVLTAATIEKQVATEMQEKNSHVDLHVNQTSSFLVFTTSKYCKFKSATKSADR